MLEDIAILTKGEVISEDLGIKLENVTVSLICLLLSGEPPRDRRRRFGLSYAAMGTSSSMS